MRSNALAVFCFVITIAAGPLASGLAAQDRTTEHLEIIEGESDPAALAKASQNPVGELASLPFQNNSIFGFGPSDDFKNVQIRGQAPI